LRDLREAGDDWFDPLLAARPSVIHGEFYAKTVLLRGESLFLVDWESAAVGAGEIDLAALTEGNHWHERIVQQCERDYARARWPHGPPAGFGRTLDAARIYLHFRWLGERPDWTVREKTLWRYDHLRAAAERLGLI
jgi:thiamine kinase-like enzyme